MRARRQSKCHFYAVEKWLLYESSEDEATVIASTNERTKKMQEKNLIEMET